MQNEKYFYGYCNEFAYNHDLVAIVVIVVVIIIRMSFTQFQFSQKASHNLEGIFLSIYHHNQSCPF